jgi:hypothetical protein
VGVTFAFQSAPRDCEYCFLSDHTVVPAARGEGEHRRVLGLQVRNPRLEVLAGAGEAVAGDGGR